MKNILKKIVRKVNLIFLNFFSSKNHQKNISYDEYIKLQLKKTSDPIKIQNWKNEEWDIKLNGFREVFKKHSLYLKHLKNALLIGSRTGQEVLAIQEQGLNAVGIDLVEFPSYTIKGDVHKMDFKNAQFDFALSNILDHILYPKKFFAELNRVLKLNSIVVFHIFKGRDIDKYSVNYIYNLKDFIEEFNFYGFELIQKSKTHMIN